MNPGESQSTTHQETQGSDPEIQTQFGADADGRPTADVIVGGYHLRIAPKRSEPGRYGVLLYAIPDGTVLSTLGSAQKDFKEIMETPDLPDPDANVAEIADQYGHRIQTLLAKGDSVENNLFLDTYQANKRAAAELMRQHQDRL